MSNTALFSPAFATLAANIDAVNAALVNFAAAVNGATAKFTSIAQQAPATPQPATVQQTQPTTQAAAPTQAVSPFAAAQTQAANPFATTQAPSPETKGAEIERLVAKLMATGNASVQGELRDLFMQVPGFDKQKMMASVHPQYFDKLYGALGGIQSKYGIV